MSRRRATGKRRKGGGLLIKLLLMAVALGSIGWVGATAFQLWQKIDTLPEVKGHDFISHQTETPVLVIAKQSAQPAVLESLLILKADLKNRTVAMLELPLNLSDGTTTIGQYLESHFYKEMQLALEGQLALPLTGYIIQPRIPTQSNNVSQVDSFNLRTPPSWWSTTMGLPIWLNSTAPVSTNLTEWQLLQLNWLMRDLELSQSDIVKIPGTALQVSDGLIQLPPDQIDPIIQGAFISEDVRNEALSIVVKNATNVDGLASMASRFAANMGGEVVAVEPADTAQTSSSVIAEKDSSLTRQINQFLGIPTTIRAQTGRERADVELIIGTDALVRLGR